MSVPTKQPVNSALTSFNTTFPRYQEQPGEAYMNSRQKRHLEQILETERAYWLGIQERIPDLLQEKTGRLSSDPADIANREIELSHAVRGRENRLIKKINEALHLLKTEGSQYGFCETCGAEIGIKRLEVRPTANLCFDCKTLDEIREKQSNNL